jgi:hypothetical protein
LLLPPPLPLLCPSAPPAAADEAAASPATVRFFTPSVISSTTIVTVSPRCAAPAVSVVEGRVWFGSGLKFLFSALAAGLERVKRGCEMRPGLKLNQCYMGFKGPPFSGATPQVFGPQSIGPSSCANCEFFFLEGIYKRQCPFHCENRLPRPWRADPACTGHGQPSGSNDDRAPER